MRFWDSSAIVPLVIHQATSSTTDAWLAEDGEIAAWTLTSVEVSSALRRLVREELLSEADARAAETRVDELLRVSHLVIDLEAVKIQAQRLLRIHALRAADALQLGAALEWANGRPAGRVFHALDRPLARAAEREGFLVAGASTK